MSLGIASMFVCHWHRARRHLCKSRTYIEKRRSRPNCSPLRIARFGGRVGKPTSKVNRSCEVTLTCRRLQVQTSGRGSPRTDSRRSIRVARRWLRALRACLSRYWLNLLLLRPMANTRAAYKARRCSILDMQLWGAAPGDRDD